MDTELNYIEKGTGKVLVMLHGNSESSAYFSNQIEYFSKEYRVIAPDTRGHGASPRGHEPFTLDVFARDLKAFLCSKGISKATILGFSDGGNIVLLFALKYPETAEKLILCGANLFPRGVKLSAQLPICVAYAAALAFSRLSEKAKSKKEMLGLMVNQPHINPRDLKKLNMPALVVAGDKDLIKYKHSRLIADSLADARLCILPGDHFVAAKNPEAFNKAVDSFLKEQ